jgi:hypothetical protein
MSTKAYKPEQAVNQRRQSDVLRHWTIKVIAVEWLTPPEFPVMLSVYVPAGVPVRIGVCAIPPLPSTNANFISTSANTVLYLFCCTADYIGLSGVNCARGRLFVHYPVL